MRRAIIAAALVAASVSGLSAQSTAGSGAVLMERYTFDPGLPYSTVTEVSAPVTFTTRVGGRALLTVSGGFTRISLAGSSAGDGDLEFSGPVDTEARLVVTVVPDRLNVLLTGVVPTGTEALDVEEATLLAALASPVIGFSTTTLGGGGRAGVGVVGSFPVGSMALGLAGSYTHSRAFQPVVGQAAQWKPGGQIRVRAGLEGAVGPRTYLRLSAILLNRQNDQLDGADLGKTGNQVHAYVSLNHGLNAGSLTLYALNSLRTSAQVEATAVGAALLPKSNLIALGGRFEMAVTRSARLVPRIEVRRLTEAPRDGSSDALEAAGSSLRVGADLRLPVSEGVALVLEGNGLFGNVGDGAGSTIGASGYRFGVHLAVRR